MNIDDAYEHAGAAYGAVADLLRAAGHRSRETDTLWYPTPHDYDLLRQARGHIDECLHDLGNVSPSVEMRVRNSLPVSFYGPAPPVPTSAVGSLSPASAALWAFTDLENLVLGTEGGELSPRSELRRFGEERLAQALQHVTWHLLRARWFVGVGLGEIKVPRIWPAP